MPEISQKARDTIRGTVRVSVVVHVAPSGEVSGAELDGASASKYFADAALQAARKWNFQSPELNGHSMPSEWRLRFEFSPSTTRVTPAQLAP